MKIDRGDWHNYDLVMRKGQYMITRTNGYEEVCTSFINIENVMVG